VRITGEDLGDVVEVGFDLSLANFTVVNDRLVIATVPLDATSGPVSVFDLSGATSSTLQHFQVSPRISGFTPSSAPPGAEVGG
jgi:hypothetical protein